MTETLRTISTEYILFSDANKRDYILGHKENFIPNRSFPGMLTSGRWVGTRKRRNESKYGRCILHPYMKVEEGNLLKLF
jgi:hypothetical protein